MKIILVTDYETLFLAFCKYNYFIIKRSKKNKRTKKRKEELTELTELHRKTRKKEAFYFPKKMSVKEDECLVESC